ncbi:Queuosine salvage protein [Citrus sinensis]|uniref:Queuosine salvage protein n=1 Tax=Citrus sinensis TaxID=2711 RepID=A0ACB8J3I4_CITSI|nr:Queuosine salvage protein [Citrus sinensis]
MDDVRETSAWVATHSSHVLVDSSDSRVNNAGIEKVVENIQGSIPKVEWDYEGIHYFDNGPLSVQYLFVLDALNFCFWPDKDLNYDHLASGLKAALQNDKSAFDADRLQKYTEDESNLLVSGPELRELLKWPRPLPLEDERVRLLHEVGFELERNFGGKASNLVESCGKSAAKLVALVTRHFAGFRDHSVYKGHQVFLYKRAQIFVADLWGAFKGQGYGEFYDIGSITMFADYVVPAVLEQLGVLKYSSRLANIIETNNEISSGSEEEVELRACSVYAVEKMKELIRIKSGKQVLSVELDLWLWSVGVQCPALQHHRTLSIYY